MKILFLQNVLFDYRVGFYNALSAKGFDITVAHSGFFNKSHCSFEQVICPKLTIGSLHYQQNRPDFDNYDVVISMFDLHWVSNILPVLYKRGSRFLFWGHGLGVNQLGNKLRKLLINMSDGMVLYSELGKQKILRSGIDPNKLYVANNTVYVSNPGRNNKDRTTFIFVGRLKQRKRVDLLLRAFAVTTQSIENAEQYSVTIVGDGEEMQSLKQLSIELHIEQKVHFIGEVTDDSVLKEYFDNALAYISPGHLGLGINHAFAYGVPIISNSSVPHAPEVWVLNESNSLWIDATPDEQQVSQLSEHLSNLITDKALACKLGEQAYNDYQNHCSMDKMVEGFCKALIHSEEKQ